MQYFQNRLGLIVTGIVAGMIAWGIYIYPSILVRLEAEMTRHDESSVANSVNAISIEAASEEESPGGNRQAYTPQQIKEAYKQACSGVARWHTVLWITVREKQKDRLIEIKHQAERWIETSPPYRFRLEIHYNCLYGAHRQAQGVREGDFREEIWEEMRPKYMKPSTQVFIFDGQQLWRYDPASADAFLIKRPASSMAPNDAHFVYLTAHFANLADPFVKSWSEFDPYPSLPLPLTLPAESFETEDGFIHVQQQGDIGELGKMHNEWWLNRNSLLPERVRFQRTLGGKEEIREGTLWPHWDSPVSFHFPKEVLIHYQDPRVTSDSLVGYGFPDLCGTIWIELGTTEAIRPF